MHKLLLSALLGAGVSMQAVAANQDDYTPEFKAYTSFSFGAPQSPSLGLHYGFRVDHDSRDAAQFGLSKPSIVQLDFSQKSGFESARVYGMPLTAPPIQLNAAGEPGVGEKILWFSGWFVLGGVIYGIHEWTYDRNPATATATPPPPPPEL